MDAGFLYLSFVTLRLGLDALTYIYHKRTFVATLVITLETLWTKFKADTDQESLFNHSMWQGRSWGFPRNAIWASRLIGILHQPIIDRGRSTRTPPISNPNSTEIWWRRSLADECISGDWTYVCFDSDILILCRGKSWRVFMVDFTKPPRRYLPEARMHHRISGSVMFWKQK
jgi:hypothetical protein